MGILDKYNVELIGAKLPSINKAEDRELFKQAMAKIGLKTPPSGTISSWSEAIDVLDMIGKFPLIIRPAFTLGGTGGGIAYNMDEYQEIVNAGLNASVTNQVSIAAAVCYAVLCWAALGCAVLSCPVLRYDLQCTSPVPGCAMPSCAVPCRPLLHNLMSIAPCCAVPSCKVAGLHSNSEHAVLPLLMYACMHGLACSWALPYHLASSP